jgi:hypothetical protein
MRTDIETGLPPNGTRSGKLACTRLSSAYRRARHSWSAKPRIAVTVRSSVLRDCSDYTGKKKLTLERDVKGPAFKLGFVPAEEDTRKQV